MKKNYAFLVSVLIASLCFSQETEFKFTRNGFTDFVVTSCEGKTQSELYKKTLDWVATTYKNPKEVIKAQIENEYIRIEGVNPKMLCLKSLGLLYCNDVRYQIEISFKNGKYKFEVIKIEQYVSAGQYSSGGWYNVPIDEEGGKAYFKENGDVRSTYRLYPDAIQTTFNTLNKNLENFLRLETIPSKKDDW